MKKAPKPAPKPRKAAVVKPLPTCATCLHMRTVREDGTVIAASCSRKVNPVTGMWVSCEEERSAYSHGLPKGPTCNLEGKHWAPKLAQSEPVA